MEIWRRALWEARIIRTDFEVKQPKHNNEVPNSCNNTKQHSIHSKPIKNMMKFTFEYKVCIS